MERFGLQSYFCRSRACWSVLIIERAHLRLLDFMALGSAPDSITTDQSIILHPSSAAAYDRSILFCGACPRIHFRERGSGRHRVACESPGRRRGCLSASTRSWSPFAARRGPHIQPRKTINCTSEWQKLQNLWAGPERAFKSQELIVPVTPSVSL